MLKSRLLVFFVALLFSSDLLGSHYMGGEITWQCLGNGRFRFIMKLYRECNGITYSAVETMQSNSPVPSIQMNLYPGGNPRDGADGNLDGKTDLSPNCWNFGQEIHCSPNPTSPNTGAVEEWYYTSDAAYPSGVQLNGTPPLTGWIFSHTSCCRNPQTNIVNAGSASWFLRAIMYPYQGQNMYPCYDNSPVFAEVPSTVICTGYPFTYNHNAADKELDSLIYSWASALDGSINTPVTYVAGFSANSPLPGPSLNPNNVAATMNAFTGEISYTSYTSGAFTTVTKVAAYRCGIKIAEIFREMQIVLLNCIDPNNQPTVAAPFYNPATGLYDLFIDTVMAGDVVDFDITAIDMDFLPNGNPNTIYLETSSQDYGTGYTNPASGCVNPPCATLNPAPPMSAMVALATHFHWQTDCNHINFNVGCANLTNVHTFYFKIFDNGCPANAINGITVTIVIVAPEVVVAPVIHCTEVLPNGDVTLTWVPPPDPQGTFNSYHMFYSTSPSGPFALIDSSFNYNQTSYTHVGAGANNGPRYYYMKSRSGCFGMFYSAPGDTAAAMHLDVTPVGGGQIADLSWNPAHSPLLGSSTGWYRIYREYPPGTWVLIDSVQTPGYVDTVTVCSAMLKYRIEIGDTIGCTCISSVDSAQLHDGFPPAIPVLDSVTVNLSSGKTELGWEPSVSPDTRKYYIYQIIGGPWFIIDSVFGINNTSYTNLSSNPQAGAEYYRIAAVDSCGQPSAMGIEHNTLFLQPLHIDVCADKITLRWNKYKNWSPDVITYRIFMSENGSAYSLLATLTPSDTAFDHTSLIENSNYCYYIRAYGGNGFTSTSNVQCITAVKPNQPQFVYMRYATVVDNEYVELGFFVDTTAFISAYKIYRSDDGINFSLLDNMPPTNIYSTVNYEDYTAYVNERSYYYRVVVVDSCNLDVLTSNLARTIYLSGNSDTYMLNQLFWTPYEDRDPQVYNLFREIEGFDFLHRAIAVQWGLINYDDDVSMYTSTSGRFNYMVEASLYDIFEQIYPFADTVYSNKILLIQHPRVYVPNAFTPGGFNPIFKPIGVYTDSENYYFAVFSRWGEKLFETTDPQEGWDGYHDGQVCPLGSYVYYVHFQLSNGKDFEKRGSVTLVR